MHNVKRFLQDATYETYADARARAASEGNVRPEDMIPIDRRRTNIDSSGREMESRSRCVFVLLFYPAVYPAVTAILGTEWTDV